VLVGLNWTLVEGAHVGLAHTPDRGAAGCHSLDDAGAYAGRSLVDLAGLFESANPFEVAVAIAAANAHHNRPDRTGLSAENGLEVFDLQLPTVVVGRFPRLAQRLPDAIVLEQNPGPGDRPASDAPVLLPGAAQVAITASALGNGTLPELLTLCDPMATVVLVGPGTPLAPALFELGIDVLSGLVVTDPEGAARAVAEAGAVRALKRHTRLATLRREG